MESAEHMKSITSHHFECTICRRKSTPSMTELFCGQCQSPLNLSNIQFEKFPYDGKNPQSNYFAQKNRLETLFNDDIITLSEGNTPTIPLKSVSKLVGIKETDAKLEFLNPTGSFKDRGASLMISAAKHFGIQSLVEDSSGNAGASIAAYSAKANINAHIFVPSDASEVKIRQIASYGAEIHFVKGNRESATNEAIEYCKNLNLNYASHSLSPFFNEGTKSFGYELVSDYCSKIFPDHIVMPVGNGSLFLGTWNGLIESKKYLNHDFKLPKLHCIQSNLTMPIVNAWNQDDPQPPIPTKSIAGGISVGSPPRIKEVLNVIDESKGSAISVKESEILDWYFKLPKLEGIFCEPTSATAFAGLEKLVYSGSIKSSEKVLIPITGSGLKDLIH